MQSQATALIDTKKCNGNLPDSFKSQVYSVAIVKAGVEDGGTSETII